MMFAMRRSVRCLPDRVSWLTRRPIVTESIEPPPVSSVPERPCTVVLAEDTAFYDDSWQEPFSQLLPQERGLHFCNISIDGTTLRERLDMLEQDLAMLPRVVLVSRGPMASLVAQYYLESFAFAGLVMVDPIPADNHSAMQKIQTHYEEGHVQYDFLADLLSGERPLKLEPGVIPMLIFRSIEDPTLEEACIETVQRHSDLEGVHDEIIVHNMESTDDALFAIDTISDWIDNQVL